MEFVDSLIRKELGDEKKIVYSTILHAKMATGTTKTLINHEAQGAVGYLVHSITLFVPFAATFDILCNAQNFLNVTSASNVQGNFAFYHFLKATELRFTWNYNKAIGTIHYQYLMRK